jgi:ubiquinone biosynthesis protein Coq4
MMTRWQAFTKLREVMKDPGRIGEIPIYKSEIGRVRAYPHVEALLADVRDYFPTIDLETLRALPGSTFGREYVRFLDENGLSPLVIPDDMDRDMLARNAFNARYGVIHDMTHVLTGFDSSPAGESGVWAFVGAQGYSRTFAMASVVALLFHNLLAPLWVLVRPRQWLRGFPLWFRGRRMGKRAKLLLPLRLEEHFSTDLATLRQDLDITETGPGYLVVAGT